MSDDSVVLLLMAAAYLAGAVVGAALMGLLGG